MCKVFLNRISMRNHVITAFLSCMLVGGSLYAQGVPQAMSYQAVIRDANGNPIPNTPMKLKMSIIASGNTIYREIHIKVSNAFGLVDAKVGMGQEVQVGDFPTIDWGAANHVLQVEVSIKGDPYVNLGKSPLLSVPYSFVAQKSIEGDEDADPTNEIELPTNPTDGTIAFYNTGAWQVLTPGADGQVLTLSGGLPVWADPPLQIGDIHAGGIIFYLAGPNEDLNGDGMPDVGLVAAGSDQSGGAQWGCIGTDIPGAPNVNSFPPSGPGADVGWGAVNTAAIVANCATAGIAAKLCNNLVLNGFNDWFLPSISEMNLMYVNLKLNGLGGFVNFYYWSSTEFNVSDAWVQNFYDGSQFTLSKGGVLVRAVRAF